MELTPEPVVAEAKSVIEGTVFARSKYSYRNLAKNVLIHDNGEPLLPILAADHIVLDPFWNTPGDMEGDLHRPYIAKHPNFTLCARQTVVKKLVNASNNLPQHWKLSVKAALRPLAVQYALLAEVSRQAKEQHPDWSAEKVLRHSQTFVTDPSIMCPPHCTGAAVDVDIIDNSGQLIDMGCPPNTDDERAFTHYDKLTPEQTQNRRTLLDTMQAAGFANLAHEWWHFSYGDQYWAAFYGQHRAIYDIVE
ncbi:MAG: M15 family metallopeptidase [Candidatus Saccharimonadales bacterium]